MAGYNPNCRNCFKCVPCAGSGQRQVTKMDRGIAYRVPETCSTCQGVGGKPGAGKHDHR